MDTKKVIEKLIKIATDQQKIINKLAQSTPFTGTAPPPPAPLPVPDHAAGRTPARTLIKALPQAVQAALVNIEARGNVMLVGFKEGQNTQANFDIIQKTLQDLTNSGAIHQSYTLKASD